MRSSLLGVYCILTELEHVITAPCCTYKIRVILLLSQGRYRSLWCHAIYTLYWISGNTLIQGLWISGFLWDNIDRILPGRISGALPSRPRHHQVPCNKQHWHSAFTYVSFAATYEIDSMTHAYNDQHLSDGIFRCIFFMENICALIQISRRPPRVQLNKSTLISVIAWC